VRTSGPVRHPAWAVHEVTLEDLVLAYLAEPGRGRPPRSQPLPPARNPGAGMI
jgi:ABC-2 type transport system ATP-binding protein